MNDKQKADRTERARAFAKWAKGKPMSPEMLAFNRSQAAVGSNVPMDVRKEENNAVLEYLEDYFGDELNESTSDQDIMEAFNELLETANAVEEFMVEMGIVSTIAKHGAVGAAKVGAKAVLNKVRKIGPRNIARRSIARKKAAGLERKSASIEGKLTTSLNLRDRQADRAGGQAARLRKVVGNTPKKLPTAIRRERLKKRDDAYGNRMDRAGL